jgi:hypothetical protein
MDAEDVVDDDKGNARLEVTVRTFLVDEELGGAAELVNRIVW